MRKPLKAKHKISRQTQIECNTNLQAGDNSVERRAGVAEALLPSTKGPEIFGGLGDDVRTELHDDPTRWLVADGNVEVALWVGPGKRSD